MNSTITEPMTTGQNTGLCGYCGNHHTYSSEMCRDMATRPIVPVGTPNPVPRTKDVEDVIADLKEQIVRLEQQVQYLESVDEDMVIINKGNLERIAALTETLRQIANDYIATDQPQ